GGEVAATEVPARVEVEDEAFGCPDPGVELCRREPVIGPAPEREEVDVPRDPLRWGVLTPSRSHAFHRVLLVGCRRGAHGSNRTQARYQAARGRSRRMHTWRSRRLPASPRSRATRCWPARSCRSTGPIRADWSSTRDASRTARVAASSYAGSDSPT